VFSPHFPDGYYRLDLARSDERRIAEMLVKLAVRRSHAWQSLLPLTFVMQVVEPGENWVDETYLDRPFELPMTWVEQVPHKVRRRQRGRLLSAKLSRVVVVCAGSPDDHLLQWTKQQMGSEVAQRRAVQHGSTGACIAIGDTSRRLTSSNHAGCSSTNKT